MPRSTFVNWLLRFLPGPVALAWRERVRSCVGALIGIAFTGVVTRLLPGGSANLPMLVAPMGASAVLLFAVPASPLAQPWSIIGGNLVSATVGVACASLIPDPLAAASVAIALAICAMFSLRCVHPPSGAVALTAVLGGPAVHALGFHFVIAPIALQSCALLAAAIVYHALTGHRYPHGTRAATNRSTENAEPHAGFTRADLDAALKQRTELLDIATDDLESLLRAIHLQRYARSLDELTCTNIMSRAPASVSPVTRATTALGILRRYRIKALPVTDAARRVVGIVTRADLGGVESGPGALQRMWHAVFDRRRASEPKVAALMTPHVRVVTTDTPLADLVPLFADHGHHHMPVVDSHTGELAGMVTQTDVIAGLYRLPKQLPHTPHSHPSERRVA